MELASFVVQKSYQDLPDEVIEHTKLMFLDTLGCGLGGYTLAAHEVSWILKLVKEQGGACTSTVLCDGFKTSPAFAALANGAMIHSVDFDDTHSGSVAHLGVSLLATIFAIGELLNSKGKDMIAAFTLGFEVAARVGRCVMPSHYDFWHPTATFGVIAAAVAAAKLMGFNVEKTELAIGHAADQAGGLRYCIDKGDFSKSLHPAFAAMKGVLLTQLVAIGATGPTGLLEYPSGFCNAYSTDPKFEHLTANLGKNYEIMNDRPKFYPTIQCSQAPIQATLSLVEKNSLNSDDVEQINIRRGGGASEGTPLQGVNYSPETVLAARLSIPFSVSLAICEGQVTIEQFTREKLSDPKINDMMSKIGVTPDSELDAKYPTERVAVVDITTKDGKTCSEQVFHPKGEPQNRMTPDEIEDKFRGLASKTFTHEQVAAIISVTRDLEKVKDCSELARMLVVS
ncbi:MmgE/PrpD family protein [Chloroflexota bacterium]